MSKLEEPDENTVEETSSLQDHKQFETSKVDERVNVTIDGVEITSEVEGVKNVEAAETETVETNEAGNVILCCLAAFLLQLYYFDL